MSRSVGFNLCVVTCSILLLSSSPPCLASQPLEERDTTKVQPGPWAGNGVEDGRISMLNLENNLGPSEQTASEEPCGVSAKPSEMPFTEASAAEGGTLPVSPGHIIPSSQSLGAHTSAVAAVDGAEFGPTKSELEEDDAFKAMLTTAVTTLNPSVQEEPVSGPVGETTTEGGAEVEPSSAALSANPLSGTAEEEAETNSHPSAAPQPALLPSSPSWETASDRHVIPTPPAPSVTSEVGTPRARTGSPLKSLAVRASMAVTRPFAATEASLHLEAGMGVEREDLPVTAGTATIRPMDTVPTDWDDTKLRDVSPGRSTSREEVTGDQGATELSQTLQGGVGEEEDATRVLLSPVSPPPTPELAEETNCTELVRGEEMSAASTGSSGDLHAANLTGMDAADLNWLENINAVTAEEGKSTLLSPPEAAAVTDMQSDLSPTLESSWKGKTCLLHMQV